MKMNPEFAAHELGHASIRGGSKTGPVQRAIGKALMLRNLISMGGGLGGAALAVGADDPDSGLATAGPILAGASQLPTLADEGVASLRGYRALKSSGKYTPEVLSKMRGNLMKAFGSYGLGAAALTAPAAAALYLRRRMKRKEEEAGGAGE
jgi:hypothetical protein